MRVVELTPAVEAQILAARRNYDALADRIAKRIVADVRRRGDTALLSWSNRFDSTKLSASKIWVSRAQMRRARQEVPREFLVALDHAARNIRMVAKRQKPQEWRFDVEPGVRVGQFVRPIESVGCYVPGGRFSLASTLLMTVIPAQVAGVGEIVVTSPNPGPSLLAAADHLGVRRIARVGGAQAIAALAYGTRAVPRVDKIVGPGNRYVTAAKRIVSSDCAIDMLAGPTEGVIFASRGNSEFIAADLLAQAEHDVDAVAIFITTSESLGRAVAAEMDRQLSRMPKASPAVQSLKRSGFVLVAASATDATRFVDRFAPEHLTVEARSQQLLNGLHSAGSIFVGDWSAQSFGDYASGTNHVLPTGGAARARGGLSVSDFVKCISVQEITQRGARPPAPVATAFAAAEGLVAHGRSAEVRR
jgi:histidinol dehydrogenase